MKKFLLASLCSLSLLIPNLMADSGKFEKSFYAIYTNSSIDKVVNEDTNYNSADIGVGFKYLKNNGLLMGVDMGYEFGSDIYAYKIEALVGYHHDWLQFYPILGVEQLELNDLSFTNYIYGLGVEMNLNKTTALVLKGEVNNLKSSRNDDFDYNSGSIGLRFKF